MKSLLTIAVLVLASSARAQSREEIIRNIKEADCTYMIRYYKDQLRAFDKAQEEARKAKAPEQAEKAECKDLKGTEKMHCQIGYDPALGHPTRQERSHEQDERKKEEKEKRQEAAIKDGVGKAGGAIGDAVEKLKDALKDVSKKRADKQPAKDESKEGWKRPADYDCVHGRGR
jgi:hypothetical protein